MNSVHCVVPELPGLSRTTQLCSPFRNTLVSPGSFNLGPWAKCQVLEPPKRVPAPLGLQIPLGSTGPNQLLFAQPDFAL